MKVLITHSSNFDFQNKLYQPLQKSSINKKFELIFPQLDKKEKLTQNIIKGCEAIIAECSLPSTGQGIELGWANTFGIPIICIYEKGSQISSALHYISNTFVEYSSEDEMIKSLQDQLEKII